MLWSYALAVVGIFGIWLAGRRNLWGWAVGCAAQGLWIVYALATEQYGFIASALAYAAVYGRNWRRWYVERRDAIPDPAEDHPQAASAGRASTDMVEARD